MTRDYNFYVEAATQRFNDGFPSEAARKAALGDVNYAFDIVKKDVRDELLSVPREERDDAHNALYWDLPDYPHLWKPKHSEQYAPRFAEAVRRAEELVELRAAIKAAEVSFIPPAAKPEVQVRAESRIADVIAKRQGDYVRGLELYDIFGGLPVTANGHYVQGHKGTVFVRHFYYLRGRLTALNVILAILDTKAREEEAAR